MNSAEIDIELLRRKIAFIYSWHRFNHKMRISINPIWFVKTPQIRFNNKPTRITPIYWANKYKGELHANNT